MANYTEQYKASIASYLSFNSNQIFLFWKGRVALYSILKAMGIKENDEIIVPAFTCVVVPNAIIYLGAKPVYVDIDQKTFNIDISKIESKITSNTKAIIAQNTFGLAPELDDILKISERYNLKMIEDCTHGFGGTYKGKKNGTIADASFFSTQWNKPFSTGIGGIGVVKNNALIEKMNKLEKESVKPGFIEESNLKALLFAKDNLMMPTVYWNAVKLYRFLSLHNFILGSSQGNELDKPVLPVGYLKGMSVTQAKKGIEEILKLDQYNNHRIEIAKKYNVLLLELNLKTPFNPEYATHTFLKFPVLVKDRKKFFRLAEENKIEMGDWFLSPLHPVKNNFEIWNYKYGSNPVAEKISRHIVNLPTHSGINEKYFQRIKAFLISNSDLLANFDEL